MSVIGTTPSLEQAAAPLPPAERLRWVAYLPGFAELPPEVLDELAALAGEQLFAPGDRILREGEEGDLLYLILRGHAEVTIRSGHGEVPLALLGPAEWFGELALLLGDFRRRASVTALTPLTALVLPGRAFAEVMERRPELRSGWQAAADLLVRTKFIKEAAPFLQLPAETLRRLARQLARGSYDAGESILRQGERGDECHLIQRGRVAVVSAGDEGERTLAELGPGELIGEVALLSEGPRGATVRAIEPCETLVLRRRDLLAGMAEARSADPVLLGLLRHRSHLHRRPGVEVHTVITPEGVELTVLKDAARAIYFRLPPEGRFLWERLDGHRSLRDVTTAYAHERGQFVPDLFVELLIELARAGLVQGRGIPEPREADPSPGRRLLRTARRLLVRQWSVRGVDPPISRLYRLFAPLFGPSGRWAALLLGLGGALLAAFALASGRAPAFSGTPATVLLLFLPALLLATLSHQLTKALAVKARGREVPRLEVGWYWLWPAAFVDTSDTWLTSSRERTLVDLAGAAGNWVGGGLAVLALALLGEPQLPATAQLQMLLLEFALISYLAVAFNLHPLLEYDGYYLLLERLEQPDLRRRAWHALASLLRRQGPGIAVERLLLGYLAAGFGYSLLLAGLCFWLYQALLSGWLAQFTTPAIAAGVGWGVAAGVVVALLATAVRELRS